MSNVAIIEPRSVLVDVARNYGMEPAAFEATVRATCSPSGRDGVKQLTREEFAAFLLVAKQYNLNPLTKEIYAYPKKGGGIVPVVSVDGWINLINSQPMCDGWDMEPALGPTGQLISYTCRMFRKDRSHPTVVTEFLSECVRDTEPWKMKHRMLRHKTLIQCGRYAFGFAGIYDEDEGERIVEASERAPAVRIAPPPPPPSAAPEDAKAEVDAPIHRTVAPPPPPTAAEPARADADAALDPKMFARDPAFVENVAFFRERAEEASLMDDVEEAWADFISPMSEIPGAGWAMDEANVHYQKAKTRLAKK